MDKNILIIQTSPHHTASTFLINALYGITNENYDKAIIKIWDTNYILNKKVNIVKNHVFNIDELTQKYGQDYNLFFIGSERKNKNKLIQSKYKNYKNFLIFQYEELLETNENTLSDIIDNIYNKLLNLLPRTTVLSKENAINRITMMNERYESIKNKPFSYVDPYYELHGSHRNRSNY